jgi:hypothetical protein
MVRVCFGVLHWRAVPYHAQEGRDDFEYVACEDFGPGYGYPLVLWVSTGCFSFFCVVGIPSNRRRRGYPRSRSRSRSPADPQKVDTLVLTYKCKVCPFPCMDFQKPRFTH